MGKRKLANVDNEEGVPQPKRGFNSSDDAELAEVERVIGEEVRRGLGGRAAPETEDEDYDEEDFNGWHKSAGMVLRVYMRNFMCHAELVYEPTPRVNFINGVNGSGKSAILAAIIFALGGSARLTNRGTANSSFIRTGQNQASVEVTLHNRGENSYKPKIYGRKLTIQRTVTKGSSHYKIKDEKNHVVTEKRVKEELDRILSTFNIHLDNPIALLNQDTAKTFLFKCHPDKLYEFFMRATQLEDCHNDYRTATENKERAESVIAIKKEQIGQMKGEVDAWEKKYHFYQTMENKKVKVNEMKRELAWAIHYMYDAQRRSIEDDVAKRLEKIDQCKAKIEKELDEQAALKARKAETEDRITAEADNVGGREADVANKRAKARELRNEEKQLAKDIHDLEQKKAGKVSQARSIKAALDKIKSTDGNEAAKKAEERQAKMDSLENELRSLEARETSTRAHAGNLEHSIAATKQEEAEMRERLRQLKTDLVNHERSIEAVRKQGDNRLVLFGGEKMTRLVKLVEENADRFRVRPIGPIGSEIRLKAGVSKKAAALIESEIGHLLRGFLVNDFNDRRVLDRLARQCQLNVPIITTRFADRAHDISVGRCDASTVFDHLEIENVNVANCLIDNKRIEKVVLLATDHEAQELLKSVDTVPPNCLYALTNEFNQFYPAPMYRSYAVHVRGDGSNNVLQTDMTEHLENLRAEMAQVEGSVAEQQRLLADNSSRAREHRKELAEANKVCADMKRRITDANRQVWHLKGEMEADKSPDVDALEEDLERADEAVANADREIAYKTERLSEIAEKADLADDDLKRAQESAKDRERATEPLNEELARIDKAAETSRQRENHFAGKVADYERQRGQLDEAAAEKRAKAEKHLNFAREWGDDPVDKGRDPDTIHKELSTLKESIKRQEEVMEPKEVVMQTYRDTLIKYNDKKAAIERLDNTVKYLAVMLKRRQRGYNEIRGSMCRRVKMNFAIRLQSRKFNGTIKFNHPKKTLELVICPDGGEAGLTKRNMKTLSGGEKSFSTVALVLALWDCIQSPFRILDEFDVFMDMVNRASAIEQIKSYATDSRRFQYIFLTPLALNSDNENPDDFRIVVLEKAQG